MDEERPPETHGRPVRGADFTGKKIVVTGATGQVGEPVALALAADNRVYAAARFTDADSRLRLEKAGVTCVPVDLSAGLVHSLPDDAEIVLNFAVAKSNQWTTDLDANVGGLAALMEHHRGAEVFVHCSTTAVYRPMGHHVFDEDGPLGDNHAVWPFLRTYSIAKIAAEATARWGSRRYGLPTCIARLSVPYGNRGGWPAVHLDMLASGTPVPVHIDAPSVYHPIHEDDIIAMLPGLVSAADVPATVVNWGGDEAVSIEDWCGYMAYLTGLEARFAPTSDTIDSVTINLDRMHQLVGHTKVPWRDGIRSMVEARRPDLLRT